MTMPDERTRSIVQTRELLEEMADARRMPDLPAALRIEAKRLLRHFPDQGVITIMCRELPDWYQ